MKKASLAKRGVSGVTSLLHWATLVSWRIVQSMTWSFWSA